MSAQGNALARLALHLFNLHGLVAALSLPPAILRTFVEAAQGGYHDNPYHNSIHGADVMQSVHHFISSPEMEGRLNQQEKFSLLLAALGHGACARAGAAARCTGR